MAEMTWTTDQQKVIDLRDRNILVSAAAGSGKTAVLVERIIQMITDEKRNMNIDNLLVVTFTKAAAGEMRERISAAIEKMVSEHPDSTHLQKQMTLIHNAQITTIDSFCMYVIRNYFHLIDLDPAFRMADEAELTLIKSDVLKEILEEQYEEGSEDFLEFVESYSTNKSDAALEDFILQMYEFSMSYPWPEEWLNNKRKIFDAESIQEYEKETWMQNLLTYIRTVIQDAKKLNLRALEVCHEPGGPLAYEDALMSDQDILDSLYNLSTYEQYETVLTELNYTALSRKKQVDVTEEQKELVKSLRQEMKDALSSIKKDFFFQDSAEMLEDMKKVKAAVNKLIDLTLLFTRRYREKKAEKNLLDFHDLEHYALDILVKKTDDKADIESDNNADNESDNNKTIKTVPSQAARDLSEQFTEIMIDEYQDSNDVQEEILTSISKEKQGGVPNVFMVGDVKQSIYKFRLAKPELFMHKYETYSTFDSDHQRIDLHKNFRSRGIVLDSVNMIFRKIMTKALGDIEYNDEAALYKGASFTEPEVKEENPFQTEFLVLDTRECDVDEGDEKSNEGNAEYAGNTEYTENVENAEELQEGYSERELEARAVAERIKKIVDGEDGLIVNEKGKLRRARYSDIVILLRTMSGWSEVFTETLLAQGIPAYSDIQSGYFQTMEIKTILNMLRILDNPRQDIPFAAILYSKIVGIGSEGLAKLRYENYGGAINPKTFPLYELARRYVDHGEEGELKEKLTHFFTCYDELRSMVSYTSIHQLILEIYRKTGFDTLVFSMSGGERRKGNLDMLVQRAIDFESTSYHGLFQFIRYIEKLLKYEIDYGEAIGGAGNDNAVRIMSIHKSKGLEFPVVILAGMGKMFNNSDTRSKIVLHPDYGIGPDCIDYRLRTKTPTLLKKAIQRRLIVENLGEELRILYVALTRAKEKLIMIGTVKNLEKTEGKWKQEAMLGTDSLLFTTLSSARCYFDFVGPVVMNQEEIKYQVISVSDLAFSEETRQRKTEELKQKLEQLDLSEIQDKELYEQLREQLNYTYPYEKEASLPIKTTVSELKKMSQQVDEEESFVTLIKESTKESVIPRFIKQEELVVGAKRGTLYHKVLECLPFENIEGITDIRREMDTLINRRMISEEESKAVDLKALAAFFSSNVAKRMTEAARAGKLVREQQFVLGIPAFEIHGDAGGEELVLIQGIIDVYFEEDGEYVLLDYKTDRVDFSDGEEVLARRYKAQLDYYERAITQITGVKVKERIIYSFALQKEIRL